MIWSILKLSTRSILQISTPFLLISSSLFSTSMVLSNPIEFPEGPGSQKETVQSTISGGRRLLDGQTVRGVNRECTPSDPKPLRELSAPGYNNGTTVKSNPSLFFYLPDTIATEAEFILVDENLERVYQRIYRLPKQSGIMPLTLPKDIVLEVGKSYSWEFALICDPANRNVDRYVLGQLNRIPLNPAVQNQLRVSNSLLEQANVYAQAGVWQETLETLAQLYPTNPAPWQELLNSVQLNQFTSENLINCCSRDF